MKRKQFKLTWPKFEKGKGFNKNRITKSTILINGILVTCILLSIASGFIDVTFFSGLSKSLFHIGTIPIAASILYTIISLGFISGKFWCAMQIGMLKELQTRLESKGKTWAKNLKFARLPWHIAHKFLIVVSIITALSLSVNSIGAGIRTMENTIKNMTADAELLVELKNSVNEGVQEKRTAAKESITGQKSAQETAKEEVALAWTRIAEYQSQLDKIDADADIAAQEKAAQKSALRKAAVNRAPKGVNSSNIDYMTQTQLRSIMQAQAMENESIDSSTIYEESIAYDQSQIEDTLRALADKEYKTPDGQLIRFINSDGSLVNIQTAISRLQKGIADWQSDTGDVGESSKIFTLVATYMNADVKAGGMGVSEWMMIVLIALFGIVQEFLIYLFTPKAAIDRKLLSQVSSYMRWESEEEKERFLISVYKSYVGDGIINQDDYEAKCKKCVNLMEDNEDDVIAKYAKKKKQVNLIDNKSDEYGQEVTKLVNDIEEIIK